MIEWLMNDWMIIDWLLINYWMIDWLLTDYWLIIEWLLNDCNDWLIIEWLSDYWVKIGKKGRKIRSFDRFCGWFIGTFFDSQFTRTFLTKKTCFWRFLAVFCVGIDTRRQTRLFWAFLTNFLLNFSRNMRRIYKRRRQTRDVFRVYWR